MIKVNLIPKGGSSKTDDILVSAESNDSGVDEIKRKGIINLLIIFLIPVGLYVYGMQVRPQKANELANVRAQINELQQYNQKYANIAAEIDQIKRDEKSVQDRIDALNKVTQGRLAEIKVLDLIQTIIRERMWLKRLSIDGGKMILEGMSQSEIDVNSLLEDLTKNVLFSSPPRLAESNQEMYEGQSFSKFKIEAQLEKQK